jgi:hypothetical protein
MVTKLGGGDWRLVSSHLWILHPINRLRRFSTNRKLHVLIRTDDPQHAPHRNGESPTSRVTHDFGCGKLIFFPASLKLAAARHKDVLHSLGLAAVCERDYEAVRRSMTFPKNQNVIGNPSESTDPSDTHRHTLSMAARAERLYTTQS